MIRDAAFAVSRRGSHSRSFDQRRRANWCAVAPLRLKHSPFPDPSLTFPVPFAKFLLACKNSPFRCVGILLRLNLLVD
jgi:hypothetical protein